VPDSNRGLGVGLWIVSHGTLGVPRRGQSAAARADEPEPTGGEGAVDPRESATIWLPRSVRRRLRLWAAFQDRDMSDVVVEAIRLHLEALDRDRAERKLPPLPSE